MSGPVRPSPAVRAFREDYETLRSVADGYQYPRRRILDASAALRRLLLEQSIDGANRDARLKLTFVCRKFPPMANLIPPFWVARKLGLPGDFETEAIKNLTIWQGPSMNPSRSQNPVHPMPLEHLDRKGWLAHTSGLVQGKPMTVRDNIDLVANKLGGVHFDPPMGLDKDYAFAAIAQQAIESAAEDPDVYLRNGPIRQIVFIAGVTYTGLRPLAQRLGVG